MLRLWTSIWKNIKGKRKQFLPCQASGQPHSGSQGLHEGQGILRGKSLLSQGESAPLGAVPF